MYFPRIALSSLAVAAFIAGAGCTLYAAAEHYLEISLPDFRSKMEAGWLGQAAGVGWGAPTEFRFNGEIIPEDRVPTWTNDMVNQFRQDDMYVEMTFMRSLEQYGWDVSIRQAGIDFANSTYLLWHANAAGRMLLREGIAPPDSGHPQFNSHADDIDYQIEADYSGLICPGMPNQVIELGEKFGRIMNYGDGVYGGQWVGAMYAAAYFETDMEAVVREGLKAIPAESQYHECISDVLNWYREYPDDWEKTWSLIEEKYNLDPDYRRFSCSDPSRPFNIDAKINGAYIAMGLLYGQGDPDKTMVISMRCGLDSDCNPSNAGGILFTSMGLENVPERFKANLIRDQKFSHTDYTWDDLIRVSEQLARQAIVRGGGEIVRNAAGEEVFRIPVRQPVLKPLEQSHEPGPIANSRFTKEEMEKIVYPGMQGTVDLLFPGWQISNWDVDSFPGMYPEVMGEPNVLATNKGKEGQGCMLSRDLRFTHFNAKLVLQVGRFPWHGRSTIKVRAGGKVIETISIDKESAPDGWMSAIVGLPFSRGETVNLVLESDGEVFWKRISVFGAH